jgi:hypothetical protein
MEKEEIFKSGFIEAFIEGYFEHYTYNHYPSKDRLLYILCSSEEEKEEVTIEQISRAKIKISELGFDKLSFSYLKSGKKESLEYIAEKRHEFWVNKFAESFEGDVLYFNPIYEAVCLYNEVKKISKECFEIEDDFWEFYPDIQKPKIRDLITIFTKEVELIEHIEFEIDNYIESEYWEFDFDEYRKYIEGSKPLELLFNLCELLVQLDRLEMFNSFKQSEQLISAQQIKAEQEQPKAFEELFYNPEHVETCLRILRELQFPAIDTINNYIGKAKGVFPLWIKVLKSHKPEPLIKHFADMVYRDLLNDKIKGLNLTKDASEFRKQYVRLEKNKVELDIKTILSQYSQSGKLGK